MNPAKAYRIETERLIIRCYHPSDADLLKQSIDESLDHLRPWMPWALNEPEPLEKKVARLRKFRGQFDLGLDYTFGMFNKAETQLIGSSGLHTRLDEQAREIGYWLNVNYLRQGYGRETVQALTKVGFDIEGLERIEIHCDPDNLRSQQIPQHLGYVNEATLRNRTTDTDGNKRDLMIWTMLQEAYVQSPIKNMSLRAFDVLGNAIELDGEGFD
ncbi:MAG: GNAT family protein [Bacteroidota bacterium]